MKKAFKSLKRPLFNHSSKNRALPFRPLSGFFAVHLARLRRALCPLPILGPIRSARCVWPAALTAGQTAGFASSLSSGTNRTDARPDLSWPASCWKTAFLPSSPRTWQRTRPPLPDPPPPGPNAPSAAVLCPRPATRAAGSADRKYTAGIRALRLARRADAGPIFIRIGQGPTEPPGVKSGQLIRHLAIHRERIHFDLGLCPMRRNPPNRFLCLP